MSGASCMPLSIGERCERSLCCGGVDVNIKMAQSATGLDVELKTKNLWLRSMRKEDTKFSCALMGDRQVTQSYEDAPRTEEEIKKRCEILVERWLMGKPFSRFVIMDHVGTPIGTANIGYSGKGGVAELGGMGIVERHQQGLGSEALRAMLAYATMLQEMNYGLGEHSNDLQEVSFTHVQAVVAPNNVGAVKLLSRAGFSKIDPTRTEPGKDFYELAVQSIAQVPARTL